MCRGPKDILWLLLLTAALTAGCGPGAWSGRAAPAEPAPGGALEAWATGQMVQLTERTAAAQVAEQSDVYDAVTRTVRLTACGNETAAFQVVVEAIDGPLRALSAALAGPTDAGAAPLPASWVTLLRAWPVEVRQYPAWYRLLGSRPGDPTGFYDRLVPVDAPRQGLPADVPAGGRVVLWADVRVPREAHAGRYRLYLDLSAKSPGQGRRRQRLTVELEVLDVVLGDTRGLPAVGAFDHRTLMAHMLRRDGRPFVPAWLDREDPLVAQGLVIIRQLMTLAHEHRMDLFDTAVRPALKRDERGQVRLYWQDYDAVVRPYLDGTAFEDRLACPLWPAPLKETWPDPARYGGPDAAAYHATAEAVIAQTVEHFAAMGAAPQLFFWPVRRVADESAARLAAALAERIRARQPRSVILWPPRATAASATGVAAQPLTPLDMVAPLAWQLEPPGPARVAQTLLVPGQPPYVPPLELPAGPCDVRALPWLADRAELAGLLLTDVLGWPGDPNAALDAAGAVPATAGLFYPGRPAGVPGVLPSVRLKWLRRGLEDLAYLSILRQRDRADLTEAISRTLARYLGQDAAGELPGEARLDGWAHDARSWEAARRLLAQEALAAVRPEPGNRQRALAVRLAWQRLDEVVHDVVAESVYTRLTATERPDRLKVTIQAELFNPLGRPAWLSLSLPAPPAGVEVLTARQDLTGLAPSARQTAELSYTTPIGPAPGGKATVPLRLAVNGRAPRVVPVRVPLLLARRAEHPPTIDGDLGDWPVDPGSTAAEFRLVGRRGRDESGAARWPTAAFVACDERMLYVAFRSTHPAGVPTSARPANVVQYEHHLAIGEDLVELVLDPGRQAAGPEGLYRLAIKTNGVQVAGRGIPAPADASRSAIRTTAVGQQPWAAGIMVAIGRSADAWAVELAIPRAAFGRQGRQDLWGANFIRHTPAGTETSSWSQAPRHFWDPRTLGTLLLDTPATGPR